MSSSPHSYGWVNHKELSEPAIAAFQQMNAAITESLRRMGVLETSQEAKVVALHQPVGEAALSAEAQSLFASA